MKPYDPVTWLEGWNRELRLARGVVVQVRSSFFYVHADNSTRASLDFEDEGLVWHRGHDDPAEDDALVAAWVLSRG